MKNVILFLAISLFHIGIVNAQGKSDAEVPILKVEKFQDEAGKYVDKAVFVSGIADHVCKHAGKKMFLADEKEDITVQIFAGEIDKFPRELEGSKLMVKAVVKEEVLGKEYLERWEEHIKKDHSYGDDVCETEMESFKAMKEKIEKSEKGYISSYYLVGVSYEKL